MIKKTYKILINRFYDLTLSTKLFLSYFIISVIPLFLFAYFLYANISQSEIKKIEYSANQSLDQTVSVISSRTKYVTNIMDLLFMDDSLQKIAQNHSNDYYTDLGEQIKDSDKLFKLLNSIEKREGIVKFKMYIGGDIILSKENSTFFNIEDIKDKEWYSMLLKNRNKNLWCSPKDTNYEQNVTDKIAVMRIAKDMNNLNKDVGILRLDLSEKEIREVLIKSKVTKLSQAFILNSQNQIISTSADNFAIEKSLFNTLPSSNNEWKKVTISNLDMLYSVRAVEAADWRIVMTIPYSDVLTASKNVRAKMLVMALCILIISFCSAYFISRTNTRRLKAFIRIMKSAEVGDFNVQALPMHNDEIGGLARNFNSMLTKIAILIDEKFELGKKVKNSELKALQAQINPHFLYNTLDLINWFSLMGKDEELREVVVALSNLYKLSLNKGEDITTLSNELKHISEYVLIQNKRFANKITLVVEVNDELLQYQLPKLTLQPIVENAILHGIMERDKKQGLIIIIAKINNDELIITITDDGVGMDEKRLEDIQLGKHESKGSSYGITNIRERLETLYGVKYGVKHESEKGVGTKVIINLPLKK